jgi:hypothetical protein
MYADTNRGSTNRANPQTRPAVKENAKPMLRQGRRAHDVGLRNGNSAGAPNTGLDARIYFEDLRIILAPLRETLFKHPIYTEANSLARLREFMGIHVFAVWDFMSLVKRLQREVTCQNLPWMPPSSPKVSRFANEVVLGEESDLDPKGTPASHFELYLRAMGEVGADTAAQGFHRENGAGNELESGAEGVTSATRNHGLRTRDFALRNLRLGRRGGLLLLLRTRRCDPGNVQEAARTVERRGRAGAAFRLLPGAPY